MGICKCRKRTDWFCFVHKRAVCENCMATEHQTCVVKKYVDWLTDSDYDDPTCGICKGALSEENVIRLMCLDLFHPECLDVHASSLPPHTAKAGFLCPTCTKPIFPTDQSTTLAKNLHEYLNKAAWSSPLISGKEPDPVLLTAMDPQPNHNGEKEKTEGNTLVTPSSPIANNTGHMSTSTLTSLKHSASTSAADSSENASFSAAIASRKPVTREHTITIDDEDEDKYKKRSVMQLFYALGVIKKTAPTKGSRQTRIRLDTKRILIIFALMACLATVIVMGMSLTGDSSLEE